MPIFLTTCQYRKILHPGHLHNVMGLWSWHIIKRHSLYAANTYTGVLLSPRTHFNVSLSQGSPLRIWLVGLEYQQEMRQVIPGLVIDSLNRVQFIKITPVFLLVLLSPLLLNAFLRWGTPLQPTSILPVVVWPDISSPAQSFASVNHPTSGSWLLKNPGPLSLKSFDASFCRAVFGVMMELVLCRDLPRQHMSRRTTNLWTKIRNNPAPNVTTLEMRKYIHFDSVQESKEPVELVVFAIVDHSPSSWHHCTLTAKA